MDARSYWLRQRRNRIWGSAELKSNKLSATEYTQLMASTMVRISTDKLFPLTSVFDHTLPSEPLENDINKRHMKRAAERVGMVGSQSDDIFMDCSTSSTREPEFVIGSCTCIRPTHKIYYKRLERFVTVKELWLCQGLFPWDFPNPDEVNRVISDDPHFAHDLAGRTCLIYIYQCPKKHCLFVTIYICIWILNNIYIYI